MVRPDRCVGAPQGLSDGGAQEDVDRVAVARAGGMAAQPVEVVGIARRDLAERPALVAAEVEPQARAIGAQRVRVERRGWRRRGASAGERDGDPTPRSGAGRGRGRRTTPS